MDNLILLGDSGSGKTTLLLERAADCLSDGQYSAEETVILCASPARAEQFRQNLRHLLLDRQQTRAAFSCAFLRVLPAGQWETDAKGIRLLLADDFDRYPEDAKENLRRFLQIFPGKFLLSSSPDDLPVADAPVQSLNIGYRTDRSLQNAVGTILGESTRQGMRQDNEGYPLHKYFRMISLPDVVHRPEYLLAELERLKRRRTYESRPDAPLPRIVIGVQNSRQMAWTANVLRGEALHAVGIPPVHTPAGRILSLLFTAVMRNDPPALYALLAELGCAPSALAMRYLRQSIPALTLSALTETLNGFLGQDDGWKKLCEITHSSPRQGAELLCRVLPAGISRGIAGLLPHLDGGIQACAHRLASLPWGVLPPEEEEILLCTADHPDFPAADYLLLPFVTQTLPGQSDRLLHRVLSAAGRSVSVMICGSGEKGSWQESIERGLIHAADR